ncbi:MULTISPECIES: carbamoyl phosphate synthase small subunit [unclassified Bacillus (in: firmicutes)]|uniref:carbamoyl phosphate synthase small subunit n=1 Tax=unclassified Bacillus (in: firmicutes) TaxID=185979 RepID=UPI0008F24FB2|nr:MULTISPECIES: carbamoyl phosphate synthase small subunit [unclassified Bacillus (in: firmicutes)]SFA78842.1 carbamoyl-phosphate synthase small subunit [Bacillus sp. UNCCL13]SFQ68763.1 carbamoyl-phosphate synthase small subunit [Bacillus sp. cl95]
MNGYIKLSSGEVYSGEWKSNLNHQEDIQGEIVFYTGMTGYQEVLTDPSYKGQIVVFTYPLIGNYGINETDFESKQPHVAGVIVYEASESSFHYEAKHTLREYLNKWNIPLLSHVDTRSLVKKIRKNGSMQAVLSHQESPLKDLKMPQTLKIESVTVKEMVSVGEGEHHVVLVDYGFKKSILDALLDRNCMVTIVPYHFSFEKIAKLQPDGLVLSNGPGDPLDLIGEFPKIKKLLHHYPTLGICLGHQLSALSLGAMTSKLTFGHRGANHPVYDVKKNKVIMSSQNHSFVVEEDSLKGTNLVVRFKNLHDQSIEGLYHQRLPIQTVQFHPEANPGPSDSEYIFDEFMEEIIQYNGRVRAYA